MAHTKCGSNQNTHIRLHKDPPTKTGHHSQYRDKIVIGCFLYKSPWKVEEEHYWKQLPLVATIKLLETDFKGFLFLWMFTDLFSSTK
jgi:hypothetical protein